MKKLFFFFSVFSCSLIGYGQAGNNNSPFQEEIISKRTPQHIKVPGTKIFVKLNQDFEFEHGCVFLKSDREKIKPYGEYIIFEDRYRTFESAKTVLTNYKTDTLFYTETKFNGHPAIYFEGVRDSSNELSIQLLIDIDSLALIIATRSQLDYPQHRKKMLQIMETIVYDKTVIYDPLEIANFTFNKDITKFPFVKTFRGSYKFTEDGIDDKNQMVNSMDFRELYLLELRGKTHITFGYSLERSLSYAKSLEDKYKKDKNVIRISNIGTAKIGQYEAVSFEIESSIEGRKYIKLHSILNDKNRSVEFTGYIYNRFEEFRKKYRETLESVFIN